MYAHADSAEYGRNGENRPGKCRTIVAALLLYPAISRFPFQCQFSSLNDAGTSGFGGRLTLLSSYMSKYLWMHSDLDLFAFIQTAFRPSDTPRPKMHRLRP